MKKQILVLGAVVAVLLSGCSTSPKVVAPTVEQEATQSETNKKDNRDKDFGLDRKKALDNINSKDVEISGEIEMFGVNPLSVPVGSVVAKNLTQAESLDAIRAAMNFIAVTPALPALTEKTIGEWGQVATQNYMSTIMRDKDTVHKAGATPTDGKIKIENTTHTLKNTGWEQGVDNIKLEGMNITGPYLSFNRTWYIPTENPDTYLRLTSAGQLTMTKKDNGKWVADQFNFRPGSTVTIDTITKKEFQNAQSK